MTFLPSGPAFFNQSSNIWSPIFFNSDLKTGLMGANDIPFFVNAYGSMDGRFELNTHFNQKYSDKLSSTLFKKKLGNKKF